MLLTCRTTHVLWVILDAEFNVTFICKFDPRKGQLWVKLGQIRSNFEIKIFLTKHAYPAQIYLSVPKMTFVFIYDN